MEVTVTKTLNGVGIHPGYIDSIGNQVPMTVIATYNFEVPELGFRDVRHLDLIPFLTQGQKQWLEQRLAQAQQVVDQHG